jgi:hypothetical protein
MTLCYEFQKWFIFTKYLGFAVVTIIMLILDSSQLSTIAHAEPIGDFEANSFYTIEYTHVIDRAFFGAIHNISNAPIFVQGEFIRLFNHEGQQIDYMYIENPMTLMANSYGYFNATAPEMDFSYYIIRLILQTET